MRINTASRRGKSNSQDTLWNSVLEQLKKDATRKKEMDNKQIDCQKGKALKYYELVKGNPGAGQKWTLFVCLHGGGGTSKATNDSQWQNILPFEKNGFKDGTIAVAPRGIEDTWNTHFVDETYPSIVRLIENYIIFRDVEPNRVFLMGFSAGGDGTYALSERIPFMFAACSPQAGHPNGVSTINLSNLPMYLAVGEKDTSYKRNEVAVEYYKQIIAQNGKYLGKYEAKCEVVGGSGHSFQCWKTPRNGFFNGEKDIKSINDTAFTFMYSKTRNPLPSDLSIDVKTWFTPLRNYYTQRGNTFYYIEVNENPPAMIQLSVDYNNNVVKIKQGTNFKINFISNKFKKGSTITIYEENNKSYQVNLSSDSNYAKRNMQLYCDPNYGFDSYIIIGSIGKDPYQGSAEAKPLKVLEKKSAREEPTIAKPAIKRDRPQTTTDNSGTILTCNIRGNLTSNGSSVPVPGGSGLYILNAKNGNLVLCTKFSEIEFAWFNDKRYWEKTRMNGSLLNKEIFHCKNVYYFDPKMTFKSLKPQDYYLLLRHDPSSGKGLETIVAKVFVDEKEIKNEKIFSNIPKNLKKNVLSDQFIMKINKGQFKTSGEHEIRVEMFSEGSAKGNWSIDGYILIPVNGKNGNLKSVYKQNYFDQELFGAP